MDATGDISKLQSRLGDFYLSSFSDIIFIQEPWEIIFCYLQSTIILNLHNGNIFRPDVWEFLRKNKAPYSPGNAIDYQNSGENYQNRIKPYSSPWDDLTSFYKRDRKRNQINKEDYKKPLKEIEKCCLKNKNSANPLAIFKAFYKHLGIGFGLISVSDSLTQMDFFQDHEAICVFAILNPCIYYLIPRQNTTKESIKSLFEEKLISHIEEPKFGKGTDLLFHCGCRFDIFDILDLTSKCKCSEKLYKYEIHMIKTLKEECSLCNKKYKGKKEKKEKKTSHEAYEAYEASRYGCFPSLWSLF